MSTNVDRSETSVEAIVRILFGGVPVGEPLASGWVITQIAAEAIIRLTATKGDAQLRMWVCPTTREIPAYRSTARFRIGYEGSRADEDALRVLDQVVAAVARNEAAIPDATYRRVADAGIPLDMAGDYGGLGDLQWLAVRAGLKPACRQHFGGAMLQQVIARAEAAHLHVECLPAAEYLSLWTESAAGGDDTLVFVAATPAAAKAALEAERVFLRSAAPSHQTAGGADEVLGRALGYPSCCVQFFAPRVAYSIPRLQFAAFERTEGRPSFLLNNIDLTRALVPHYVCRYDCPASMRYARALLAELERVDPRGAATLAASLRGLLVLFRDGGYLWLRGDTTGDTGTFAFSGVSSSGEWPERAAWLQAAEESDRFVLDGTRARFLGAGGRTHTFAFPSTVGIARVFA